jgi:putative transcriptional regulator
MACSGKIIFKLDALLKERNYPKLRLSKNSGLDYRTVLRYCKNDVQNIKVFVLERLCQTLECKVEDLIEFQKDD